MGTLHGSSDQMNFHDGALEDLWEFKGGRDHRNGQVELRDKWNENPVTFSTHSDDFYRDYVGDSYLYDLAYWHASKTLGLWINLVAGFSRGVVWDFGGGIGSYSLLLASMDDVIEVWYDDINPENREFAQWRFEKHGLADKIKLGRPKDTCDTIVALDVIEHLTDPHGQMLWFAMCTHKGSRLVVNVTAHDSGGEHPMHIMGTVEAAHWWEELQKRWDILKSGSPSVWTKK